jgi:hypothetical protein
LIDREPKIFDAAHRQNGVSILADPSVIRDMSGILTFVAAAEFCSRHDAGASTIVTASRKAHRAKFQRRLPAWPIAPVSICPPYIRLPDVPVLFWKRIGRRIAPVDDATVALDPRAAADANSSRAGQTRLPPKRALAHYIRNIFSCF